MDVLTGLRSFSRPSEGVTARMSRSLRDVGFEKSPVPSVPPRLAFRLWSGQPGVLLPLITFALMVPRALQ